MYTTSIAGQAGVAVLVCDPWLMVVASEPFVQSAQYGQHVRPAQGSTPCVVYQCDWPAAASGWRCSIELYRGDSLNSSAAAVMASERRTRKKVADEKRRRATVLLGEAVLTHRAGVMRAI
ncbi:hypothetical protein MTO96_031594 [Rhipicephalus appendiculatus]